MGVASASMDCVVIQTRLDVLALPVTRCDSEQVLQTRFSHGGATKLNEICINVSAQPRM